MINNNNIELMEIENTNENKNVNEKLNITWETLMRGKMKMIMQ